jgi:hypothetical protein
MPDTDQLIACGYTWYSATCETCGQTVNFVGSEFTHEEEPEKVAVGVRRNWSQLFDKTCP